MSDRADISLRPGLRRWYDPWARYLALVTVLLTLAITVVVFFTAGQNLGGLGDLVTACIGLLGLAISLQIETLFRIAERARTRERYGRLLEGVEDHPDLLSLATDTLEAGTVTLRRAHIPQFKREVFNVLAHAHARLQELAQGRLRADGGDNTLVLERLAHTERLLQGTTDERDMAWWRSDAGVQFLNLNEKLLEDPDVTIERIWIVNSAPSGETLDQLDAHREAGIKVFVVRSDRGDIDRRLLVNLTIMDGEFLHQDLPNKEGQTVEYLYSENASDLERARNIFAQLKSRATEYSGRDSIASAEPASPPSDVSPTGQT